MYSLRNKIIYLSVYNRFIDSGISLRILIKMLNCVKKLLTLKYLLIQIKHIKSFILYSIL